MLLVDRWEQMGGMQARDLSNRASHSPAPATAPNHSPAGLARAQNPTNFCEWSRDLGSHPTIHEPAKAPAVKSTPSSRQSEFRSSIPALSNSGIRDHHKPQSWLTANTYVLSSPSARAFRAQHDHPPRPEPISRPAPTTLSTASEHTANDGNDRMPRRPPS